MRTVATLMWALMWLVALTAGAQEPTAPDAAPQEQATPGQLTVSYVEKEMWAPAPQSFPNGLDVLEVYANRPGRHPLMVLTHGTSDKEEDREHVTPWSQLNQARWFARRGYVVFVVVRKGYGRSG